MNKKDNIIENFDSEDDIITELENSSELYDIKGNLITVEDAKNTLPDNTDLIQKAIDGDKKAFEMLYMQSYRYVFFVARQYIPDDETTYDVIQETFIKVFKGISSLRSPNAYYSWLTTIAKNTAKNFLRSKHSESSITEDEDYSVFLKQDQTQKDVELDIETVLKELQPQDAELLSLVYYDGMRVTQIAKIRGVPAATVYTQLNRAKRNLKSQLAVHGIDKSVYSGNFVAMIATAIRNIIGTALLSVAIAQQILNSIVSDKGKKEIAVAKVISQQQKRNVLKIASCIVAISVITSMVTAFTITNKKSSKTNNNNFDKTVNSRYETESDGNNSFYTDETVSLNASDGNNSDNSSVENSNNTVIDIENNNSKSDSSLTNESNNLSLESPKPNAPDSNPSIPDDVPSNEEMVNVFGNNPNNVTKSILGVTGRVARHGEWIYYVSGRGKIMKIKSDGSQSQLLYEDKWSVVSGLNIIDDTLYYTNNGVWSIKSDGTNRQQYTNRAARNLLVRENVGWYVVLKGSTTQIPINEQYSLYQIDFTNGEIKTFVENGSGLGLKTVIGDKLIYVNGDAVYSHDLNNDNEELLFDISSYIQDEPSSIDFGINNIFTDTDNSIYIQQYSSDSEYMHVTYKIDLDVPNAIQDIYYGFDEICNCFDYDGGTFFAKRANSEDNYTFFDLQGNALCEKIENINADAGIYNVNDGYAYFFDSSLTTLYCIKPDGTDLKTY